MKSFTISALIKIKKQAVPDISMLETQKELTVNQVVVGSIPISQVHKIKG